jgi:hypothetical protein
VTEGEVIAVDPGRFDLVHSRFLLMHLREREELVPRLASWLKPGGWLVLTDYIDLTTASSTNTTWSQVMAATWNTLRATIGTDITWTRHYPTVLAAAGLGEVGISVYLPSLHAGSPGAKFMRMTVSRLRERLVEFGEVSAEMIDEVLDALGGSGLPELAPGMITAWGRRSRIQD